MTLDKIFFYPLFWSAYENIGFIPEYRVLGSCIEVKVSKQEKTLLSGTMGCRVLATEMIVSVFGGDCPSPRAIA